MPKRDKGIMPREMRDAISAAQKERYAEIRERLNLAPGERIAASPVSPSSIMRLMPPPADEDSEETDSEETDEDS